MTNSLPCDIERIISMIVHHDRPLTKTFTFIFAAILEFDYLLALFLEEIYKDNQGTVFVLILMVGTIILAFVTYFCIIKINNYTIEFNEKEFIHRKGNKVLLEVDWDNVTSVHTFKHDYALGINFGPNFLSIDYFDENQNKQTFMIAFSVKDARKLQKSGLNEKLNNIINEINF